MNRQNILKRDNFQCQECGRSYRDNPQILEIHHKTPLHKGGDPHDPENCITLCPECHRSINLAEEITSSIREDAKVRADVRDHANTIEAFASDSIEITKMNILLASILIPGISILFQIGVVTTSDSYVNVGILAGGIFWFISTGLALSAYYSCRISSPSLPAIEEILEEDGYGRFPENTKKVYQWNAKK